MKEMTYEQALKRLEEIVVKLEEGSAPLEKSLELYEEASKLASLCKTCLDKAEQQIVNLSDNGLEEQLS